MPAIYDELLGATIRHLESLKAHGDRHVIVSPDTLRKLSLPPAKEFPAQNLKAQIPKSAAQLPEPKPAELLSEVAKSQTPEVPAKSSSGKAAAF
ncbi:MAG TPA: hypothetical protein VGY56_06840, partial [Verrucomicrobiae bacterium]|nr:hypothetical protein [Verrucomicrobiae bacterium]